MISPKSLCFAVLASVLMGAGSASAQLDRVYPLKGTPSSGAVIDVSPAEVTLRVGSAEQKIPVNSIRKIVFDGDPSQLSRGRDLVLDGQFDTALEELKKVDTDGIDRDLIKADARFYRAFAEANLALSGQGDKSRAVKALLDFVRQYRNSWHFYESSRLLGDLALAMGSYGNAVKYYGALAAAPFPEYKLEATYLEGWALLKQERFDEAAAQFDKVVSASADTQESVHLKKLARAGRAVCQAHAGEADAGVEDLRAMIAESDPSDIELFGRLYNALGACLSAKGDDEGAVLAYLHTDQLFSGSADAHVEALQQLVQLWPKIGKPERGTEARSILERKYPGASG